MSEKRTWFGFSTPQQRKLLFDVWEKTKDIQEACWQARVSLRFFYYWRKRFEQDGYGGLEDFKNRVAHKINRKEASVEGEVIRLKTEHSEWGKLRIAQEMAKANDWKAVISPNTVRRILQAAQKWPENAAKGKKVISKQLGRLNSPAKRSTWTCVSFLKGILCRRNCLQ